MEKKLLLIINPVSGLKLGLLYLPKIVEILSSSGFTVFTMMTGKRGDAAEWAESYGENFDLIVAVGGDGTFNEVVGGNIKGAGRPLGYIPCGSTNDFASSIGLKTDILSAAKAIVNGSEHTFDAGRFGDRTFTYVASFGAFTKASYSTPQNAKNILGHLAYILESGKELSSLKAENVSLICDEKEYSGKYIFGAISNSTSLGGVVSLDKTKVDMNDGKFEVILIKKLSKPSDLSKTVYALTTQNLENCDTIEFFESSKIKVLKNPARGWSLDGEFEHGQDDSEIENVKSVIRMVF